MGVVSAGQVVLIVPAKLRGSLLRSRGESCEEVVLGGVCRGCVSTTRTCLIRFVRIFDFRPLDLEGEMSPNVDL